jgi:transcriptional regulator with XRE-family HTH domain
MNIKLFSKRLEELRKEKKLSQEELGKRVGLSRFPIIDWEAGRKAPDILPTSKMAVLIGVSLDYLLGDGGNGNN